MPLGVTRIWDWILSRAVNTVKHDQTRLIALAIVTGLAAALASSVFRELLGLFQWLAFQATSEELIEFTANLPWWQRLLAPAVGGLIVGYFIYKFVPGGRPVGVPQVMEDSALHGANMSFNQGIRGALANAATLGFGGSAGREGPVVHFGATIGAKFARWARLPREHSRTLLACGVAGAVAASFNADISGTGAAAPKKGFCIPPNISIVSTSRSFTSGALYFSSCFLSILFTAAAAFLRSIISFQAFEWAS